jgi:dTDP-4-dehydrorhamnose reductase
MPRPTILLTGARGQIGFELARLLVPCGDVIATDRAALDLADPDAIVAAMRGARPSLVVNAGAYTAVDLAEKEAALARAVNARAPGILAEEAKRLGAVLIHYSTDYVFDGTATAPYPEDALPAPQNVYGVTKLDGERAIAATGARALVFRTSWVYGTRGRNFLLTIRRLAAERDELTVVADQIGTPNWCRIIAEATVRILESGPSAAAERAGLYHLSSGGHASWYDFARAIIGDTPRPRVVPIATASYPTPARRPSYSVLATARFETTFAFALPGWREGLARCLAAFDVPAG